MWNTDSNGNYLSNIVAVGPGTSTALETIETTFNQDLNGDGTIGIPDGRDPDRRIDRPDGGREQFLSATPVAVPGPN